MKYNFKLEELYHDNLETIRPNLEKENNWEKLNVNELNDKYIEKLIPILKHSKKTSRAFLNEDKDKKLDKSYIKDRYEVLLAMEKIENDETRKWHKACIKDKYNEKYNEKYHLITSVNYKTEDDYKKTYDNKPLKNKKAYSPQDGNTMNSFDPNWYISRTKMAAPHKFWKSLNLVVETEKSKLKETK
jgi:hypothetical protein